MEYKPMTFAIETYDLRSLAKETDTCISTDDRLAETVRAVRYLYTDKRGISAAIWIDDKVRLKSSWLGSMGRRTLMVGVRWGVKGAMVANVIEAMYLAGSHKREHGILIDRNSDPNLTWVG